MIGRNRKLSLFEIKEAFPECLDIIDREVKRLTRELKVYDKEANRIKKLFMPPEHQDFLLLVMREIYMKPDKRFKHLAQLKSMQQLMRNNKFGDITPDDISMAREVDIWTLYDFKNVKGKTCLCPFHDDRHNSFAIKRYNNGVQGWVCFSCQAKGSGAIDFVMKRDGVLFTDAVKLLINKG